MKQEVIKQGVGIWTVYTITMALLKGFGLINVSWWIVFAPQILVISIFLLIILICMFI